MPKYVLTHAKCVQFYDEHPHLDFNLMNALMIEFYKQTLAETDNSKLDTKSIKKLLKTQEQTMIEHQKKVSDEVKLFREIQTMSSKNINDSIKNIKEFQHISQTTIDNVQRTLSTSNSEISNIISGQLNEYKKEYLSEVKSILSSNSLKSDEQSREKLDKYLDSFSEKFNSSKSNDIILNNINKLLDDKHSNLLNNIQQPIFSHLNTSEDRITKSLSDIREKTNLFEDIKEQFDKQHNSSYKGQNSENKLEIVLNTIFPSSKIENTTGIPHSGDFIVDRGENKIKLLFENKDYNVNIPPKEIEKFINDCDTQNCCGVFLSQNTGITLKEPYQIDIHKGNVLVYIHETNYDPDKINIAVQIIDSLYNQLESNIDFQDATISKELLERINKEYQLFISQKKELLSIFRESHKKFTSQLESFQLPCMQSLLMEHFAQVETNDLQCSICNSFTAKNNRSLSAHKRGCSKKNISQPQSSIEIQIET